MERLYTDYLQHYGIKGMKWGRRRYENYDGTLTEAGKRRYNRIAARTVNPSIAKNAKTRRAAEDYHRLSEDEFLRKYKTKRGTFARRYRRTKGDTYSLGKARAARANRALDAMERLGLQPREIAKYKAENFAKRVQKRTENNHSNSVKSSYSNSLLQKQLNASFGQDWHDKDYMRSVFEIDDPYRWAADELKRNKGKVIAGD